MRSLGRGPLLLSLLLITACGDKERIPHAPSASPPAWAKVAPAQLAEAKKHGVPVAFENDLGMRFVLIPAGTFLMGSPEDEEGRGHDETQHEVTLTKPYYMQITEVTNAQYQHFDPDHGPRPDEDLGLDWEQQPVAEMTWEDAHAFGDWLARRADKRTYRLPTEAEWEHAARAGTRTPYFFGSDKSKLVLYVNFAAKGNETGEKDLYDGQAVPTPVGSFRPNPWGLYDILGNVYEWCSDWYVDEYETVDARDPVGPASGEDRVLRSGCCGDPPKLVRAAMRVGLPPDYRSYGDGCRVVSPLPQKGR